VYQDHVSAVRWLAMAVKNDFGFLGERKLTHSMAWFLLSKMFTGGFPN